MSAKFGPAGNSDSFSKAHKSSLAAPKWIADFGLDCYEYQCGKGVRVKKETAVRLQLGRGLDVLAQRDSFAALLQPAGLVDPVPEGLIDAASAVSGCGPAFAYLFLEALADGGVACGLPRAQALEFAAQMTLGSARLALESGKHPGELKDAVCSPGGSTIQGVRRLEEAGFRGAVMNAVIAACEKSGKLK